MLSISFDPQVLLKINDTLRAPDLKTENKHMRALPAWEAQVQPAGMSTTCAGTESARPSRSPPGVGGFPAFSRHLYWARTPLQGRQFTF